MFALLFDRRSLIVTGVVLAGVAGLLFSAGVVTGLTLRRERVVVPPYWLSYGPVETSDVRATGSARVAGPTPPSAAATASGSPASGAAGGSAAMAGGEPAEPDWVPFAAPGEPDREAAAGRSAAPGTAAGAPALGSERELREAPPAGADVAPPRGATRAAPEEGAGEEGAGEGGAKQDGAKDITPDGGKDDSAAATVSGSDDPEATEGGPASAPAGSGPAAHGPATAPPPAERTAPLPGAGGSETALAAADCRDGGPAWFVQAGAYSVPANAQQRSSALRARFASHTPGAASQPVPHPYFRRSTGRDGAPLTLVRLGPFPTRQAAQRAAAGLGDSFVGLEEEGSAAECAGTDAATGSH